MSAFRIFARIFVFRQTYSVQCNFGINTSWQNVVTTTLCIAWAMHCTSTTSIRPPGTPSRTRLLCSTAKRNNSHFKRTFELARSPPRDKTMKSMWRASTVRRANAKLGTDVPNAANIVEARASSQMCGRSGTPSSMVSENPGGGGAELPELPARGKGHGLGGGTQRTRD
eukprot:13913103-Alexandrium_andersonii.AAC.1